MGGAKGKKRRVGKCLRNPRDGGLKPLPAWALAAWRVKLTTDDGTDMPGSGDKRRNKALITTDPPPFKPALNYVKTYSLILQSMMPAIGLLIYERNGDAEFNCAEESSRPNLGRQTFFDLTGICINWL
jgi:hypothetical protein